MDSGNLVWRKKKVSEYYIFWSEIWSGFDGEPSRPHPPKIPRSCSPPPPSSSPRTSEEGREPSRRRNWWIKCIFWTESREPRAHCSRFFTHNDLAFAAFINRSFMKLKGRGVQSSLHWIMEQLFYQGQLENISWEMLEKISVEPEALFSTTVCFVRLQYGRANVCIIKGI